MALLVGAVVGMITTPQPNSESLQSILQSAPAPSRSGSPSEYDAIAARMNATKETCTNEDVKQKYRFVSQLKKQIDTSTRPLASFESQVNKIWDGYGLCKDRGSLTDADAVTQLTTTMYAGDYVSVLVKYNAKKYGEAR